MANIKNKFTQPLSTEFSPKDLVVDIKNGHLYYKSNLGVHKLIGDNLSTDTEEGDIWQSGISNIISYTKGNVGIGTTTPGEALEIEGNISASGDGLFDNVGIGTTPAQPLHVAGNARVDGDFFIIESNPQIFLSDSNHNSDFSINLNSGLFKITDTTNTADRITLDSTGNVGIGIENPTSKLHVVDNSGTFGAEVSVVKFQNTSTDNYSSVMELHIGDATHPYSSANMEFIGFHNGAGTRIGRIHGNTGGSDGITIDDTPSDRRLKHDIKDSTRLGIDTLMKLRMVDYKYIKSPNKVYTSVIAQECKEVYPDAVSDYEEENITKGLKWGDDGYQPMFIKSNKFIPLLLTAVQDQQKIIEKLKARIEKIENN